jgi:ATP-dependent Clp protease, protease subunit
MGSISTASLQNVKKSHVLFQCTGGGIGEGICLYNFFRNLSLDLTRYNAGSVSSVGVVAYLGAKHRKVSKHAMFMIHRTQTTAQAATTNKIKALTESAILFDRNTEAILREHIHMPSERWAEFDHNDVWFSAEEAIQFGIADEISDFSPPLGGKIFVV